MKRIFRSLLALMLVTVSIHQVHATFIPPANEKVITHLKYEPRGIGGGGAIDSFSPSPYDENLWFVGTDMGVLFRSEDKGGNWATIPQYEVQFSYDLPNAADVGFSADNKTVFHAFAGCYPKRSSDRGKTWKVMESLQSLLPTGGHDYYDCWIHGNKNRIRYWHSNYLDENIIFAGGGTGLFRTDDKGDNWTKIPGIEGESKGTFIDYSTSPHTVYHASNSKLYKSIDGGVTFAVLHEQGINGFAGGRDVNGLTLAFTGQDIAACTALGLTASKEHCGYVWISTDGGVSFTKTNQVGGDFIRMAENNSQVMYTTGAADWEGQWGLGTAVWKSVDAGATWAKTFQQYVDNGPYYQWDPALFEMGGIAYDVGLHDDGYHSFSVHRRNANLVGGTENYFLHVSEDQGVHWTSPYTTYADSGARAKGKRWKSNGLEVTSAHSLKFHPNNPKIGYAGYSDIGGLVTDDGGETWRLTRIMNTIYDHAFDPADETIAYAATSTYHDWPHGGYRNIAINPYDKADFYGGGIYKMKNYGESWQRLTPDNYIWNTPFLSVAHDTKNDIIYAGSQGRGVARSADDGVTWSWFNKGLPSISQIVGQIEIDPDNNDIYIMLSGDAPNYTNHEKTGIYRLKEGSDTWQLLRGTVHEPYDIGDPKWNGKLWLYPVHFAIDWNDPNRQTMWLTDVRIPTVYLAEGIWKTEDGGQNWHQKLYMPDPKKIAIHPNDSDIVYLSGIVDGAPEDQSDESGAVHTTDGGKTWIRNFSIPSHKIISSIVFDPTDLNKVFYTTFGNGMYYGPNPVQVGTQNPSETSQTTEPVSQGGSSGGGGSAGVGGSGGGAGGGGSIGGAGQNYLTLTSDKKTEESQVEISDESKGKDGIDFSGLFLDTKNHWSKLQVEALAQRGVISPKAYFYPNEPINRAEFIKMLSEALNYQLPVDFNLPFIDVSKGSWYAPYTHLFYQNGFIQGYSGNLFKPSRYITRAEAVKIMMSAYGKDLTVSSKNPFIDLSAKDWSYKFIQKAYQMEIVSGYEVDGRQLEFRPNRQITRAESAALISKFINYLNQ